MTGEGDDAGEPTSTPHTTPHVSPVEPDDARERPPAPRTDLTPIVAAVESADADAFVAVGDHFDDDLRYLTRFSGPDRDFAVVVVPATANHEEPRAILLAPALFTEQAEREFVAGARTDADGDGGDAASSTPPEFHDGVDREIRMRNVGNPAGERAADAVTDLVGADADLLVPQGIPHDAAVFLETPGHTVASTPAVAEARTRKTPVELDCLRFVQRATARGMARAETVLAESEVDRQGDLDGNGEAVDESESNTTTPLHWNGTPLTTERLRRQVNATLAAHGVRDAGNTVVGAGPSAADLHYTGVSPIHAGDTVLLDVSPRGPHGYYGDMTRTFVVDGDGGWGRRAYVACEAAREAALAEIEPGVTAGTVHTEAAAEIGAYGFEMNADEGEAGFTHGTGHGVGVSLHEAPSLSGDAELQPGHVVTVEPGVYDPERGGVRLEDLVVVTEDGYEILATYPFGLVPESR